MLIDSLKNKQKILKSFLEIAAVSGWNEKSLQQSMREVKIDEKYLPLIFPNTIIDITDFYIKNGNKILADKIFSFQDFEQQKIRDKIRFCLYERFEIEIDNKKALQSLAKLYLDPKNIIFFSRSSNTVIQPLKISLNISDTMWSLLKDKSTDFNYYTKRLVLSKIILRIFPVFLNDDDIELRKTKKLIDAEIEKVMKFEKLKYKTKNIITDVTASVQDFVLNEEGEIKDPGQIIKNLPKNLPFVRLFKDRF